MNCDNAMIDEGPSYDEVLGHSSVSDLFEGSKNSLNIFKSSFLRYVRIIWDVPPVKNLIFKID